MKGKYHGEPIVFCNYSYVVHTEYIYIFFSSTEQCAWAIISLKEFKSWVTCISFALLPGWQNYLLSNILLLCSWLLSGMCVCLHQHPWLVIFSSRGHDQQSSGQNNWKLISLHNNGEDDKHAHWFADF
jgi:hypothetical protein